MSEHESNFPPRPARVEGEPPHSTAEPSVDERSGSATPSPQSSEVPQPAAASSSADTSPYRSAPEATGTTPMPPGSAASPYPSAPAPTARYPHPGTPGYPGPAQGQSPDAGQTRPLWSGQAPAGPPHPGPVPQPAPHLGGPSPYGWPVQPTAATNPGRVGKFLAAGAAALVLMLGSGIAGGVIALTVDDRPSAGPTYHAAPIIDSADLPGIAEAVRDSVVSINTGNGEGSGVVLTEDGYILTNNHVVAGAPGGQVRVIFASGKSADGRIVGTDPRTDLAVVRANGVSDLSPATFGDSDAIRVGDSVLALGSPLGLQGSVTAGIISAKDRAIRAGDRGRPGATISGLLQTDAPINPGNSGGALVNTRGEVIGINTAIATAGDGGGNIGVGFAIPSNKAKAVAEKLMKGEKVSHPTLGVQITPAEGGGALVAAVVPGSPAERAGLRQGDVIIRFGDREINDDAGLVAAVQARKVGDRVEVTFLRNGVENRATVTLAEAS